MATKERKEILARANESLTRMQGFDTSKLPQVDRLGDTNFTNAIEPAERLIGLYKQLPIETLELLPVQALEKIRTQADGDFQKFEEITKFDTEPGSVRSRRDTHIDQLENSYDPTFMILHPWVSYSVRRTTDLTRLEQEARAAIRALHDDSDKLRVEMTGIKSDANRVLEEIRRVAEEQGVSQQASYFKAAATEHDDQATKWLTTTKRLAIAIAAYAVLSLFLHKITWLKPESAYETAQLIVSKVLIFAVLSYLLYLSARNFLSQRHNAIINKHRQDALTTYRALVEAAGDTANRDIVLTHASACIFAPQPTGFAKDDGGDKSPSPSLINLIAQGAMKAS